MHGLLNTLAFVFASLGIFTILAMSFLRLLAGSRLRRRQLRAFEMGLVPVRTD
jgi:NADH:ubiquinone oxidoreductase subunit 3 (subunit A)